MKRSNLSVIASLLLLICVAASSHSPGTEKERVVKAYYSGFEKHDWNTVLSQFAEGFTFTSPAGDDHISLEQFKERCWVTNKFIKKVDLIKMTDSGDELILLVEIATTDNKLVRNVDIFNFKAGKIKSIECFFGAGEGYPGKEK